MIGLPTLASSHTAISAIAVLAGLISLLWHREISPRSAWGRIYIFATIISCVTGFFIYNQGGFGTPHVLGIIILVMLRIGTAAGARQFGSASPYIEPLAFTATFFFSLIPAIVEVPTRLPVGAPLVASRESPVLLAAIGGCFVLFLIVALLQVLRVRRQHPKSQVSLKSIASAPPASTLPLDPA